MDTVRRIVDQTRRHRLASDAVVALAWAAHAALYLAIVEPTGSQRDADWIGYAVVVAMGLTFVWRRRHPVAVTYAAAVVTGTMWVLDYAIDSGLAAVLALYSLGSNTERPRSLRHAFVVIVALTLVSLVGVIAPEEDLPPLVVVAVLLMFTGAFAVGDSMRNRRAYLTSVEERARRAEADREVQAQRAVGEERARIAREVHDIVAHSLSVMVLQATAARRQLERDPGFTREALGQIERTGRESLDDLRRILGVLRADDTVLPSGRPAPLTPQPDLGDLDDLVQSVRRIALDDQVGLRIMLTTGGPIEDVPAALSLSAYRIVQEALTNALKHAGPAQVTVDVGVQGGSVVVSVSDDGRGLAAFNERSSVGVGTGGRHGLVGMRERVELYGGTLDVGANEGGGFVVHARLPLPLDVHAP